MSAKNKQLLLAERIVSELQYLGQVHGRSLWGQGKSLVELYETGAWKAYVAEHGLAVLKEKAKRVRKGTYPGNEAGGPRDHHGGPRGRAGGRARDGHRAPRERAVVGSTT